MTELQIFENDRFGEVRTIMINNEPWFVGKDVAEILGYSDTNKAIAMHVDADDKLNDKSSPSFGQRGAWVINESGLYSLIMSSKLPTAKDFKRWVTAEVLPTIRKHGAYMTPATIEEVLTNPDTIIKLAQQLKEEREKTACLEPKAAYYDTVADSTGLTSFRETAKVFGIKEHEFIKYIEDKKLCYRDSRNKLIPYAENRKTKWFEVKEVIYSSSDGPKTTVYTKITPTGRTKIFELMRKDGIL